MFGFLSLILFIIAIVTICYVYIGYPLTLIFLSLIIGKKHKRAAISPSVSLIISAYNEEKIIHKKIENSLALDYPSNKIEIIVASESNDRTNAIVQGFKNRGVKLFSYEDRQGKASTLYRVVPHTSGEIIVFSDANSIFEPQAIKELVANFADPEVGCVSGMMLYKGENRAVVGTGQNMYWKYEICLKKLASRLKTCTGGVHGSIFALKREAYMPINRFRGDDFELTINAAIAGYRIVFEPKAVSYEEFIDTMKNEFKRRVRISSWNFQSALILFLYALKKKQFFIPFQLLSHKILRWIMPFFLSLLFISNTMLVMNYRNIFFDIFLIVQITFYILSVVGFGLDKIQVNTVFRFFLTPYYFCSINAAAIYGVWNALTGKTKMYWEKNR